MAYVAIRANKFYGSVIIISMTGKKKAKNKNKIMKLNRVHKSG